VIERENRKAFNREMHLLRAVGIILVVLGHCLDPFLSVRGMQAAKDIIYSFHMPLFFFISGFFGMKYFITPPQKHFEIATGQFKRLMVVYFFCSAMVIPLKFLFNRFADRPIVLTNLCHDLIFYPDRNPMIILWFLFTLFLIQMIFLAFNSLLKIDYRNPWTVLAMFAGLFYLHLHWTAMPEIFDLHKCAFFSVFFFLGFIASVHYEAIRSMLWRCRFAGMILPAAFIVYPHIKTVWAASFIYAGLGTIMAWMAASTIYDSQNRFTRALLIIGDYAFAIYLYHYFFIIGMKILLMQILHIQSPAVLIPLFIFGLVCPILLAKYLLMKNAVLRGLALGNWRGRQ